MEGPWTAHDLKTNPIVLKAVVLAADISQTELAAATGVSRYTISLCLNRGYIPSSRRRGNDFRQSVEAIIADVPRAVRWLLVQGLSIGDIWNPLGRDMMKAHPSGLRERMKNGVRAKGLIPGDPDAITMIPWEVEMISPEAQRFFKLFRNPFVDDVMKDSDIYMGTEHSYIYEVMLDAGRHSMWVAVIGEVGSGKTTIRKKVIEQLRKDGDVLIIFPQIVDKGRINASSICDAIIMDLSDERPKIKLEQKTRQVRKILEDRTRNGYRCCLIIEEAHDLTPQALKHLKRFHELEDGYRRLLGIILIGQTELKHMFNEAQHVEMREVIRRVQVAEIHGLGDKVKDYLTMKFRRIGANVEDVFTEDAFEALSTRLTAEDKQHGKVSHAYPLLINNYASRAINLAFQMGETRVTRDVVMEL